MYVGILLIKKGICYVEMLVCKYWIWEDFLVDKLDYDLLDVYMEVEVLEYVISEWLVDFLEVFLGNLMYCLYGGVIFDKDGYY